MVHEIFHIFCPCSGTRASVLLWYKSVDLSEIGKHNALRQSGSLLAGPGSDGIVVTWKDNFDAFYSEVAELGRYDMSTKAPSTKVRSLLTVPRPKTECCHQ